MIKIQDYLKMADVRRCSGVKLLRPYDLIRHSFMTTILFQYFAGIENIIYDKKVIDIIMKHDILEVKTGDLISPVKSFNQRTKNAWHTIEKHIILENPDFEDFSDHKIKENMNEEQFRLFKTCDLLELWIFIVEEILLGNRTEGVMKIYNLVGIETKTKGLKSVIEFMAEMEAKVE